VSSMSIYWMASERTANKTYSKKNAQITTRETQ
jgi:hypothetical protein